MNRDALATLDSALFVLSLDDAEVLDEVQATHTLLHNYGANRYLTSSPVASPPASHQSTGGLTSHLTSLSPRMGCLLSTLSMLGEMELLFSVSSMRCTSTPPLTPAVSQVCASHLS